MTMYRIQIDQEVDGQSKLFGSIYSGEVTAIVKWMRDQAERIRKERYMATPRFEGEEPLEGLDLHFEPARSSGRVVL